MFMFFLVSSHEVCKKSGDILFTGKAFNNRVVMEWLAHCLRQHVQQNYTDERIPCMTLAMILSLVSIATGEISIIPNKIEQPDS